MFASASAGSRIQRQNRPSGERTGLGSNFAGWRASLGPSKSVLLCSLPVVRQGDANRRAAGTCTILDRLAKLDSDDSARVNLQFCVFSTDQLVFFSRGFLCVGERACVAD